MSTDLEEPEVETEMIVLSKDKGADNDALIVRLGTEYLSMKCNGPEDRDAFEACDRGRKRLVKFRTGLAKTVKDLVKPLKDEVKRIGDQADKYQTKLTVIEDHLKAEVQAVKDEEARREAEEAEAVWQVRKSRLVEAGFEPLANLIGGAEKGFPDIYRMMSEVEFESTVSLMAADTRRKREEAVRKIEQDAADAKRRADEAQRLKEAADKLAADQAAFALQQREAKAASDLIEQQQREAQQKIDAETRQLASERRAREETDKPVAGGSRTSPSIAGDAPAAAPSEDGPPASSWVPETMEAATESLNRMAGAARINDLDIYDRGYVDGMRHLWGSIGHKFPESALTAQITNRKSTQGYDPPARA